MKNILFIATSADKLAGNPTGIWFEELSTPYYILKDAGFNIDISSPKGGALPVDPNSIATDAITESVKKFQSNSSAMQKFNNSIKLSSIDLSKYSAIFFPGGHGAMADLPEDKFLKDNLGKFFESGKLVAAVCHGPAGLVAGVKSNGKNIVDGLKFNCFTDAEEIEVGGEKNVPFMLQTKLTNLGGKFEGVDNFQPFAIIDKNLITGQNPASSELCAKFIINALS
jgi:putative intracellular protease/amidase